jgi:hypothetical protein
MRGVTDKTVAVSGKAVDIGRVTTVDPKSTRALSPARR